MTRRARNPAVTTSRARRNSLFRRSTLALMSPGRIGAFGNFFKRSGLGAGAFGEKVFVFVYRVAKG